MSDPIDLLGIKKLIEYVTSGIGSAAGTLFAPQIAKRRGKALEIEATHKANAMTIIAKAQEEVSTILDNPDIDLSAQFSVDDSIKQVVNFQQERRMKNIEAVSHRAAEHLSGVREVPDQEPDHDWTARFFNEVQDVSSEEMQELWARVLAGEVERPGSTSKMTLDILRNMNKEVAEMFKAFCTNSIAVGRPKEEIFDLRILSLDDTAVRYSPELFELEFYELVLLNEHGLIMDSTDFTIYKYDQSIIKDNNVLMPLHFQSKLWGLQPLEEFKTTDCTFLGIAATHAGRELSRIVEISPMQRHYDALTEFLGSHSLKLRPVLLT